MKKGALIVTTLLLLSGLTVWLLGGQLSAPASVKVGPPPLEAAAEDIVVDQVHGWFFPASEQKGCVLLLHSVRSNLREMAGRALFLQAAGYSSFAIDLQAHGETPGQKITYGYEESASARSALAYLKVERHCRKVVALGSSLGGAASLLGAVPLEVDGYILEAVYPGIERAVENRLEHRLGDSAKFFAPLLYQQIPLRLGIELNELQPAAAIRHIKAPVLIINGSEDKRTTLADAELLYNNAPTPKALVEIEGAPHTNLYSYNPTLYENIILSFLAKYIEVDELKEA